MERSIVMAGSDVSRGHGNPATRLAEHANKRALHRPYRC
jgi:hypothetical protein